MGLDASFGLEKVVTCTTRPRRRGEEKGGYHFLSNEAFNARVAQGEFIEWALVYGHLYGVLKDDVLSPLAEGRSLLLLVDVQGARSLRTLFPQAWMVFIAPPDLEALVLRASKRGVDSQRSLQRRRVEAEKEMAWAPRADFTLVNDDLARARDQLHSALAARLGAPL